MTAASSPRTDELYLRLSENPFSLQWLSSKHFITTVGKEIKRNEFGRLSYRTMSENPTSVEGVEGSLNEASLESMYIVDMSTA